MIHNRKIIILTQHVNNFWHTIIYNFYNRLEMSSRRTSKSSLQRSDSPPEYTALDIK